MKAQRITIISIPAIIIIIIIITIMAGLLFRLTGGCMALPLWPVTQDPYGAPVTEDRIGYEDGSYLEFWDDTLDPNAVIEYRVGDEWVGFPHRLNSKNHPPHTVHILFETGTDDVADARSLVLAATTDGPMDQLLWVFLDGLPVHCRGGEKIQPRSSGQEPFQKHTLWLGSISKGEHRITLSNGTDPNQNTAAGIFFDYIKLVPGDKIGISLLAAEDTGSAAVLEKTTLGPDDPAISGILLPRAHFCVGFWNLRITGLKQGGRANVEIRCPKGALFKLTEYYTYDGPEYGWKVMSIEKDTASSAVSVELTDGGSGDSDPNQGTISHIGGIAAPFSLASDTVSTVILEKFTALKLDDPAISGSMPPRSHFYAGFWNLQITGLEQGGRANVEIRCPEESYYTLQEYYVYEGPEYGWR
ncbi:MAG: choice-of-anchor U domain-containing protein, partial [bacterium]